MTTLTLPANGWTPRDYQLPAWRAMQNDDIKTVVLAWARRHGKDEIALHATAIKAMKRVGNYYHALPKYSQARKAIWEARDPHSGLIRWKQAFPPQIIDHVDNQTMMVKFKNGSTWQLIGSDNIDALMGTTPAGVVFSEAALADATTYAFFRPILLENKGWSIHVSSTRGKNHFYDLYKANEHSPHAFVSHISAEDTDVFTEAELDEELRTYVRLYGEALGRSLFDQEYLSRWEAAVVGAVWGRELRDMDREGRIQPLPYDPRFPVNTSWDLGVGDPTVILFWQSVGGSERLIDWLQEADTGLEFFVDQINRRGYLYGEHFWPHDGAHREFGAGISRRAQAKRMGLNVKVMPNIPKTDSLALASQLLKRSYINASDDAPAKGDCTVALNAFKAYRFKFDDKTKMLSKKPVHDENSHLADALQTYAIARATDFSVHTPMVAPQHKFSDVRVSDILRARSAIRGAFG